MQKQRGVPCSPKTLARRITSIKAFFRWLATIRGNPGRSSRKSVPTICDQPLPQVLTPEEAQAVLNVANNHRHASQPDARYFTLLALLLETGIKKSECLALSPNHLDLDAPNGPLFFVRYASPQHRYKERKIPVSDGVGKCILRSINNNTSWVTGYFHGRNAVWNISLKILVRKPALSKHLSFEMCRWTCALTDLTSGMEANKVRQKMGLSKIQWREVKLKLQKLGGLVPE